MPKYPCLLLCTVPNHHFIPILISVYHITEYQYSSLFTTTSLCPNILPCLPQHHCVPIFIPVCTTTPMCPPYVLLSGTTTSLCTMQYSALFTTTTPLSPYSSLFTTKLKCTPYLIHLCLQTTVSPYSSLVTISPPCRNIHPCTHNQPWLPYHHPVAIFIPGYIDTSVSPYSSLITISAPCRDIFIPVRDSTTVFPITFA